ncbi:TonB-dependent receptor [Massilia cavernae]|uniref:TonB-dependent receptor n=1 Tax=Massilia cavernae TaxID=2320864 RepID=A0A418XS49_9BURK|nr:TonB-dependent receptor [Massilia cavernae]RJG15363.1 TonB-dependent receptor [Massilia cavernae]
MPCQNFVSRPTLISIAVALAWSSAAAAQTQAPAAGESVAPAPEGAMEQVVVRARGRDETQQGVPMSVKAFSAKAIEDAGISKPGDFVALTPNVSLSESQSVGTSFMTVRGLTQVRNGEAPVAVVVDGVTQTSAQQFTQELFDIQSIEVLRGPQGALYGRNASGGAILITTKAPTNTTRGYVQATAGNGQRRGVQGSVGGAIVDDKLLYRIGGNYTNVGGYLENGYLHAKADPYRNDALRGDLRWIAGDKLQLDARFGVVRDRAGALNYVYQPQHIGPNCSADLSGGSATVEDASRANPDSVVRRICTTNPGRNTRSLDNVALKAEYALDFATLAATASHDRMKEYIEGDEYPYTSSRNVDVGTVAGWGFPFEVDGTQTQYIAARNTALELRLTSPSDPGLRWMGGVYAMNANKFVSSTNGIDNGQDITYLSYDPAPAGSANPTKLWLADHNDNRATAAFGNLDYDLTQRVEASLALRYDRDRRKQTIDPRQFSGDLSTGVPAGCTVAASAACGREATFSAWQPKVSLRHKAADGSVAYASWGKGFRSGLFNQSGVAELAEATKIKGVREMMPAELTKSAELGYKTTLLDGKLRLNAALFDTEVRNSPYFVFITALSSQVMAGLDKVHLTGGELEATASLARGLDAGIGLGVTRSVIDEYRVDPSVVGNWAPYVPRVTGNTGVQYRFPLSGALRIMLRSDLVYKGKQYWDTENSAARSALWLLNLRAVLEDAKGKWSLSAAVENATDKAYNSEWVSGGFANPAPPRKVRIDVRFNL